MGGRVGRLVQVDDSVLDVVTDGAPQGRTAGLEGSVVACANHHAVVVLRNKLGGIPVIAHVSVSPSITMAIARRRALASVHLV